jgi:hypothetical protein
VTSTFIWCHVNSGKHQLSAQLITWKTCLFPSNWSNYSLSCFQDAISEQNGLTTCTFGIPDLSEEEQKKKELASALFGGLTKQVSYMYSWSRQHLLKLTKLVMFNVLGIGELGSSWKLNWKCKKYVLTWSYFSMLRWYFCAQCKFEDNPSGLFWFEKMNTKTYWVRQRQSIEIKCLSPVIAGLPFCKTRGGERSVPELFCTYLQG